MTEIVTYVEIDVDYCSLTYGTAPCTAAIDAENPIKCFNTLSTCQDRPNFDNDPVTLRFAKLSDTLPRDIDALPNIKAVAFTPGKISLGSNLGQRASLKVTFTDHPHSDTGEGFDKYLSDRTYNPFEQGTFWGKFRSRQTFLRGRPMRLITGTTDQDLTDMETRLFFIESFDGPNLDGTYSIVAKDILKLADGDRAQAPVVSTGSLLSGITSTATSATLSPSGIGNSEYPSSGYLNLGGKEIASFTRSGDTLTLSRGKYETTKVSHDAGARCQICIDYTSQDPADVIRTLLQSYAGVSSDYIKKTDWQAETDAFYRRLVSSLIAEPTSVSTLIGELIEQCGLALWWDDLEQRIRLQVLRTISTDAETFSDSNVIENSLRIREQPAKRISQVWVYFGERNPLEGVKDPNNYRSMAVLADTDAETDYGQPAIKKIFSRWIPFGGLPIAQRVAEVQLGRFRNAPRNFSFDVFRYGSETPYLGEGVQISGLPLQDETGASETVPIQITRYRPGDALDSLEAEEMRFVELSADGLAIRTIVIDGPVFEFDLKITHDLLYDAVVNQPAWSAGTYNAGDIVARNGDFWEANATTTQTPNDSATKWDLHTRVICIINTDVDVGSTSTSTPAFRVGIWPSRLVPQIINNGNIQGKGGKGGKGRKEDGVTDVLAVDGEGGGTALRVNSDIKLDNTDGQIRGGGGGGGGGGSDEIAWAVTIGGSGGGGAGVNGGKSPGASSVSGKDGKKNSGGAGGTGTIDGAGRAVGDGGDGGDPGQNGKKGEDVSGGPGANKGLAGAAIDGISNVTIIASGTITGPQI